MRFGNIITEKSGANSIPFSYACNSMKSFTSDNRSVRKKLLIKFSPVGSLTLSCATSFPFIVGSTGNVAFIFSNLFNLCCSLFNCSALVLSSSA